MKNVGKIYISFAAIDICKDRFLLYKANLKCVCITERKLSDIHFQNM